MHRSRRFRLSALLAGGAVIAASLLPALPAAAEEPPTPDPVATSEPVETPAPEATESLTPDPTETPAAEPTTEPTPEVTPTETPGAEIPAPAPSKGGVEYAGEFAGIADESGAESPGTRGLFQVPGYGFLSIDTAGLSPMDTLGTKVVTFAVPDGVKLSGSAHSRFTQLATAALKHPLTVLSTRMGLSLGKQTAALVNQTPVSTATHRIYAVLVSPNNRSKAPNQTAAKVQTSVNHADDYWSQQSGGAIHFDLVGTTGWYKSSSSCKTTAGSEALWDKAASVAKSQLGYVAGKNNHLVLFFPSDPDDEDCGGSIGLGSIGDSVNSGGVAWVVGTSDAQIEEATLAHELGHNLSLGHADWLDCNSATPVGGYLGFDGTHGYVSGTGCAKKNYGDATDVMGFGTDDHDGGALSSPQAIRSGIWGPESSGAWETIPASGVAVTRTLQPVSGNSGLRALVVQDDDGVNYFVEYRNLTDEDAQFAPGSCTSQFCVSGAPGVRVLRLENNGYKWNPTEVPIGFLGFPGDDSFLIGRNDGSDKVNFTTAGDTFWTKASSTGIKIQVTAIDANSATVAITKDANSATADVAYIFPTSTHDSEQRVGDTWTMFAGAHYDAQTTTFQWYRSPTTGTNDVAIVAGNEIAGATSQNYTLTAADQGHYIRAVMTGSSSSGSTHNVDPDFVFQSVHYTFGYGPILAGVYEVDQPGDVVIQNTDHFTAVTSNWPSGTTFTYQWYRGSSATTATSAISGATHQTYTADPVKDYYKFLRVKVIASVPGYANVSRYSTAFDYTVHNSVKPLLSSTRQIGTALTADIGGFDYTAGDGGPLVGLSPSYQWLRDGTAITGSDASDDADYTLQVADYNKKISVRVTSSKPGFIANVVTSAAVTANTKGNFDVEGTPAVNVTGALMLSVSPLPASDVSPSATKATVQWYRGTSKISGATKTTYKLTATDFGKEVTARITYSKTAYNNLVQTAVVGSGNTNNWWLNDTDGIPQITGDPAVGGTVSVVAHSNYVDTHTGNGFCPSCLDFSYQWLRNGAKITGADATDDNDYTLTSADKGKAISVKVTVTNNIGILYLLPNVATSAKTQLIGTSFFPDWEDAATVGPPSGQVLTAVSHVDDVGGSTNAYQWYRGTSPISGQTHDTHTIVDADHDLPVWVKVTTKKAGYTTAITQSTPVYYGLFGPSDTYHVFLQGSAPGDFDDPIHVGDVVTTDRPSAANFTFSNHDNSTSFLEASVQRTYEWYRSGVRITGPGTDQQNYTLQQADLGKTISVKIRVHVAGMADYVKTSKMANTAQKVLAHPILVGSYAPSVVVSSAHGATVTMAGTSTTPGPFTLSYKWQRNGTTISGKTTSKYTLTSSDSGKDVTVIVTAAKSGYTSHVYPAVHVNAIEQDVAATISGTPAVGQTLTVELPNYTTSWGAALTPPIDSVILWRRDGFATGWTGLTYQVDPADSGHTITVQITMTAPYHNTLVDVTQPPLAIP